MSIYLILKQKQKQEKNTNNERQNKVKFVVSPLLKLASIFTDLFENDLQNVKTKITIITLMCYSKLIKLIDFIVCESYHSTT